MKAQLSLLLISIQSELLTLISICFAFFLPISGILLMIGVLICIDTFTGIWKAKKLGQNTQALAAIQHIELSVIKSSQCTARSLDRLLR